MRYLLQLKNWFGEWEVEKDFGSVEAAVSFANKKFPQNEWRVVFLNRQDVIVIAHLHDPLEIINESAKSEITRFHNFDRFLERMAQRREEDRRTLDQRRANNETRRLVAGQNLLRQVRRANLVYHFGLTEERVTQMQYHDILAWQTRLSDEVEYHEYHSSLLVPKVNWKEEGF